MPADNALCVDPGFAVSFPQDGAFSGTGLIARVSNDTFNLARVGTYQVLFQVNVEEGGQLVLGLDSGSGVQELDYTVVGGGFGETAQLVGVALVTTTVENSLLSVRNPSQQEGGCLNITPYAGGSNPVSAHLVITRIK